MSTRSQIDFIAKGEYKDDKEKVIKHEEHRRVYRHWDGYPESVIPDLKEFLAWDSRAGDVEYQTANFIYWSKKQVVEQMRKSKKKRGQEYPMEKEASDAQLGFGVCDPNEFHDDIEYYYRVVFEDRNPEITIEVYHDGKLIKKEKITRKTEGGNVIPQPNL